MNTDGEFKPGQTGEREQRAVVVVLRRGAPTRQGVEAGLRHLTIGLMKIGTILIYIQTLLS